MYDGRRWWFVVGALAVFAVTACGDAGGGARAAAARGANCAASREQVDGAARLVFSADGDGACVVNVPALSGPPPDGPRAPAVEITETWAPASTAVSWGAAEGAFCRLERSGDEGTTWAPIWIGRDASFVDASGDEGACGLYAYRVACETPEGWTEWSELARPGTRLQGGDHGSFVATKEGSPYLADPDATISGSRIEIASGAVVCGQDTLSVVSDGAIVLGGTLIVLGSPRSVQLIAARQGAAPVDCRGQLSGAVLTTSVDAGVGAPRRFECPAWLRPPVGTVDPGAGVLPVSAPSVTDLRARWTAEGTRLTWSTLSDSCSLERRGIGEWQGVVETAQTAYLDPFLSPEDVCASREYRIRCSAGGKVTDPIVAEQPLTLVASGIGNLVTMPAASPYVVHGTVQLGGLLLPQPGSSLCLRPGATLTVNGEAYAAAP